MKRNERLELNRLSKLVYNSSSKWQKMTCKGEKVPKVKTDPEDKSPDCFVISRHSEEEIGPMMEDLWKEEQELKAAQEKEAEEQKTKFVGEEFAKQVKALIHEDLEKMMTDNLNNFGNYKNESEKENQEASQEVEETKPDVVKEILETVES